MGQRLSNRGVLASCGIGLISQPHTQETNLLHYLLRASFNVPDQGYADGQVLDTIAEGIHNGTLTIVEVDGTLAVVSNKCAFTAQATPAWGDLRFCSQAITRVLGRGLLTTYNTNATTTLGYPIIWGKATHFAYANLIYGISLLAAAKLGIHVLGGVESPTVAAYVASTDYQVAIILGGHDSNKTPWRAGQATASYLYGAACFVKGGVFVDWTLLWRTAHNNTPTLYGWFRPYNAAGTIDNFRVPDVDLSEVLQPTALSTFTADNGTSLDAITPEVGGAWTEQSGDWDIQANKANPDGAAIATVDTVIANALVDCVVNGGVADQPAIVLRFLDTSNYWYLQADRANNQIELHEYNATVDTVRASAAIAINDSTDYDLRAIADAQTINGFLNTGGKISYALAALNETATVHGIRAENTAGRFDNFTIYSRTSSVYDSVLGGV